MAMAGRPLKLNAALIKKICAVIKGGEYRKVAAKAVDVTDRVISGWMKKGRRSKSGIHHELFLSVQRAEQEAEIAMLHRVFAASKKDARHAEWWLERKYPKRWGRRAPSPSSKRSR